LPSLHRGLWAGAALVCILTAPAYGEAYLEVTATPQEVAVGDNFTLRISVVQISENLTQDFAVPRLELPPLPDVEVVNYQNQNYRVQLGGRQKMNTEAVYVLRPKKTGVIQIPALEQPYQEGNTPTVLRSEAVTIKVLPNAAGLTPFSGQSPSSGQQLPSQQAAPTALPGQTPTPDNAPVDPFLQSEKLSQVGPEPPSVLQRVLQGLFLLGILFAGVGMGWFLRRRAKQDLIENTPQQEVPLMPLQRFFPLSGQQLKDQTPQTVLNTFRSELVQNLMNRGLLATGAEVSALSNQEILKALQKQLVPLSFYEACQDLLKQDEALRYQGAPIDIKALQTLIHEGERIFQKT
jgi:hypothetical protein